MSHISSSHRLKFMAQALAVLCLVMLTACGRKSDLVAPVENPVYPRVYPPQAAENNER